jgi:hypothetical protein
VCRRTDELVDGPNASRITPAVGAPAFSQPGGTATAPTPAAPCPPPGAVGASLAAGAGKLWLFWGALQPAPQASFEAHVPLYLFQIEILPACPARRPWTAGRTGWRRCLRGSPTMPWMQPCQTPSQASRCTSSHSGARAAQGLLSSGGKCQESGGTTTKRRRRGERRGAAGCKRGECFACKPWHAG